MASWLARGSPRVLTALALLAALALSAWLPGEARAQFNGSFAIERHVLEAENFLDWRAYQPPYAWRAEALRSPNLLRGSVGSLSQKRFYLFETVRLEKRLGRYGSLHYVQREDSFFRTEPIDQEFELRLGRVWTASLVGFPRHEKVQGSAGVAVAYGDRTQWNYLRLTRLRQFDLYDEEHTGEDRFDPIPVLYRLEGRVFLAERVLAQVTWRDERPTAFLIPSTADPTLARRETYAGRKVDALLEGRWSDRVSTVLIYRRERERRTVAPLGAASTVADAGQLLRLDWWDASIVLALAGGSVVEAGVYRGGFHNGIESPPGGSDFAHSLFTDAAYGFWHWPVSEWFRWHFSFQGGRSLLLTRDAADPAGAVDERTTQLKAGVGVVLQETGSYRVFFNTTWDLDVFQHRQWDGGNVQLQWLF